MPTPPRAEWCDCQQPMYVSSSGAVCHHCDKPCAVGAACGWCQRAGIKHDIRND